MSKTFLFFLFLAISIQCFDKFSMSKDKNVRANLKHPISRRVLRYERSVEFADFPTPSEMPALFVPTLDFAKIRPEIPAKTKTSSDYSDTDVDF